MLYIRAYIRPEPSTPEETEAALSEARGIANQMNGIGVLVVINDHEHLIEREEPLAQDEPQGEKEKENS